MNIEAEIRTLYNCRLLRTQAECEEFDHIKEREKILVYSGLNSLVAPSLHKTGRGLFISSQFFLICPIHKLPEYGTVITNPFVPLHLSPAGQCRLFLFLSDTLSHKQ